ncbi:hypothetical protein AB0I35_23255 [Nocardia sp. NPDC050378]|uniref:hypothetical protein n=1 Tax=Nocardia sp. NPDC050378 TaxID=3155400 RepID=UPI0033E9E64A
MATPLSLIALPWGFQMDQVDDVRAKTSDVADSKERRAMWAAGAAGCAVGAVLLACSSRVIVSGLDSPYLLMICVVGAVPGLAGLGLLFASQQVLRGKTAGIGRAAVLLFAVGVLVTLGCVAAISYGPWIARIVMAGLAGATIATAFLLRAAHRALPAGR